MTSDERATYKAALKHARDGFEKSKARLKTLVDEQTKLQEEVARHRRTITALAAMCSEDPGLDELGITDSVMEAMSVTKVSWTTAELLAALDSRGFDLTTQKNAQASVHAVLTRLAQQGKITRVANAKKNKSGHPWEWRGPNYDMPKDVAGGYCDPPAGVQPVTPLVTHDDDTRL